MLSPMPRISAKPREYLDKQSLSNKRKTAVRSCCDAADALQDFAPPRSVRVHACASKISFGTEDTCVVLCADGSFEVVKPDRYAFATYTHQTTFFFFYDSHRLPAFFVPVHEARLVAVLVVLRRQWLCSPAPMLQMHPSSQISHFSTKTFLLTHKQYLYIISISHARFISKALTLHRLQRRPWIASEALACHLCSAATLRRLLLPGPASAHRDKKQRSE